MYPSLYLSPIIQIYFSTQVPDKPPVPPTKAIAVAKIKAAIAQVGIVDVAVVVAVVKVIRKFFLMHNKSFGWHLGDYEKHNSFPFEGL